MIGWHYTTVSTYNEVVVHRGLVPQPVHPRHHTEFAAVEAQITNWEAIWVYKSPQRGDALLGMLIYVAASHGSARICLLRVDYDDDWSASELATRDLTNPDDMVRLTHTLTVDSGGRFGHRAEPIDLIVQPVPPKRIELMDQWDLYDMIGGRECDCELAATQSYDSGLPLSLNLLTHKS